MNMEQLQKQARDPAFQKLAGEMLRARSVHDRQEKVERFRHLNRFVRKGEVLFAGSSLMEQFPISEFATDFDLPAKSTTGAWVVSPPGICWTRWAPASMIWNPGPSF